VSVQGFQTYLAQRNLALLVVRNVTARDHKDQQQPYNLHVPGGTQTIGKSGKIYDIAHLQLYQADMIRGLGLHPNSGPKPGRRPLAERAHDPLTDNPPDTNGPPSSVLLASDGSVAAIVPARRAMSWQLTAPDGTPVVRERYWITFQPGEIRTCTSCHGVNTRDQAGRPPSTNSPLALRQLLQYWKAENFAQQVVVTNGGTPYLGLTFKRQLAATNIAHTIEISDDLIHWADGSRYTGTNATPNTAATTEVSRAGTPKEVITVRDNLPLTTRTNRFLRVRDSTP
jgi:hypothetical protein